MKRANSEVENKGGIGQNIIAIFSGLIHSFGIGIIVCIMLYHFTYWLQRCLYQRSGETLIGGTSLLVGVLALTLSNLFFVNLYLLDIEKRYFPVFYWKYCADKNSSIKVDIIFKKMRKFFIGFYVFSILLTCFFIHEYIAFGDKYIAASASSVFNNRKEYKYSDVAFSKEPGRDNSKYDWRYVYKFPDGKTLSMLGSELGGSDRKIIGIIQEKQKDARGIASDIKLDSPVEKKSNLLSIILRFLPYSIFFFIPWTLKRLFKEDKIKKDNVKSDNEI